MSFASPLCRNTGQQHFQLWVEQDLNNAIDYISQIENEKLKEECTAGMIHGFILNDHTNKINYEDSSETAWFNYLDGSQWHQVWFDNYKSLERKFDYIFNRDLGGLGIWAYGYQKDSRKAQETGRTQLGIGRHRHHR